MTQAATAHVEVHVLGGLRVAVGGRAVAIGGRRQRALLAFLALHANEVVSADRIVEALWGETPTATARSSLRVAVAKLRRELAEAGAEGILASEPSGYVLRLEPDGLDALRFASLAAHGRAELAEGNAEQARELLGEALALWSGPALSDVVYEPFAAAEAARLEEERLGVLEARLDADLAVGRHAEVVGELETLVDEHPHREALTGRLMLALYRSGRQADALEAYRRLRARLSDELGLEPGPELRALEQAILRHDESLSRHASVGRAEAWLPSKPRRAIPVRVTALAVAVLVSAVVIGVVWVLTRSSPEPVLVLANSVAVLDQDSGRVVANVRVGAGPADVVVARGAVWIANVDDRTITRVDQQSRQVLGTIGLGFEPTGLAASEDAVWVVGGFDHALWRIDTADGRVRLKLHFEERIGPLPTGFEKGPAGVAVGERGVWVSHGIEVTLFDERTGAVRQTVEAGGPWVSEIAAGEGAVWVAYSDRHLIPREQAQWLSALDVVDSRAGVRADRITLISDPDDIEVKDGYVWVSLDTADAVWRIDPHPPRLEGTMEAGDDPTSLAFDRWVWISNQFDATVSKLEGRTGARLAVFPVGHRLDGIAAADGEIWVAVRSP